MASLDDQILSSNISIFKVYIEEKDHDISGVLVNDYYEFYIDFEGVRDFFTCLDEFFDYVNFPMAATEPRSFERRRRGDKKEKIPHIMPLAGQADGEEREPDFILHVQFRQGSTWQGTLNWLKEDKTTRFRSELELIELIMKALEHGQEKE